MSHESGQYIVISQTPTWRNEGVISSMRYVQPSV